MTAISELALLLTGMAFVVLSLYLLRDGDDSRFRSGALCAVVGIGTLVVHHLVAEGRV